MTVEELKSVDEETLDTVKHVLFGKQKQANVQLDTVAAYVAVELSNYVSPDVLDSETALTKGIYDYLQHLVDTKSSGNFMLVALIAGVQSLEELDKPGPKVVTVSQPNPESPKNLFRIYPLGYVPEENTYSENSTSDYSNGDFNPDKMETPKERVQRLIIKWSPKCKYNSGSPIENAICALYSSKYGEVDNWDEVKNDIIASTADLCPSVVVNEFSTIEERALYALSFVSK